MNKLSEDLLIQALYHLEMDEPHEAYAFVSAVWMSEFHGAVVPEKVLEDMAKMRAQLAINDAKWRG